MSPLSLSEIPPVDPWWDLYMPASFGEVDAVLDALEAAEASVPLARRGDVYAIAARAFAVLGRFVESERLAEQAFKLGGAEAEALATFVAPDGFVRAARRVASGVRPGARADAACDLAALHLAAGDLLGARAAVAQAEELCPGHGETARWARFLGETPDVRDVVREARDPRRTRRQESGPAREAVELLPVRRTGWLSVERYHRRILGTPPESAWAPAGSALGRLQDAGVGTYFFALDVEYARTPGDHPLVGLELAADALRARVEEGRDAAEAAARFWDAVCATDTEAQADGAQMLAGLGTAAADIAPTALAALEWLATQRPDRGSLWEGYRAWLEHVSGRGGVARARTLAAARPADPVAWRMAIETLRAAGAAEEATRLVRAARSEPALCGMACELLETRDPAPFRMIVSGRITPRWPPPQRRRR